MAGFDSLERAFLDVFDELSSLSAKAEGTPLDVLCKDAPRMELLMSDADDMMRKLDTEARVLEDPAKRPVLLTRLRELKLRLLAVKKNVRNLLVVLASSSRGTGSGGGPAEQEMLHPGGDGGDYGPLAAEETGAEQRARLLSSTARLQASSGRLQEARTTALQSENIGVSILQDLHGQRQSLLHTHDMIHDVDDDITRARRILHGMVAKANRNKWITGLILCLLFAAISLVIYFRV